MEVTGAEMTAGMVKCCEAWSMVEEFEKEDGIWDFEKGGGVEEFDKKDGIEEFCV